MWALQRKVLLLQTSVWAKTNTSACWPGPVSRLHTDKGRVTYQGATNTTPQTLDGPTAIDMITS